MVPPAATGFGVPLFDTAKSQATTTGVVVVVVLTVEFVEESVDVAVIEATVTVGATLTATRIVTDVLAAKLGSVQVTFPVPPTAGVVQVHPAGADTDANVEFAGTASWKLTPVAAAGPLLVTV